jgi:histidinol dehydrogenase
LSEFAFFRFLSLDLLTQEEKENKAEVISVTEQVLDAEGIECDSKISKLSEEKINEILAQVRKRRRKIIQNENLEEKEEQQESTISA